MPAHAVLGVFVAMARSWHAAVAGLWRELLIASRHDLSLEVANAIGCNGDKFAPQGTGSE
jgi:hypothetical protein